MNFRHPPSGLDRDLVFKFFWKFSVFECALKGQGFLKPRKDERAEADWERFGQVIKGEFNKVSISGFKGAVDELCRLAPKCQVVRDGHLGWKSVDRGTEESDEGYTLRLLKVSRNNLFHGGKYPDGDISEVARDRKILYAGLKILDGCYELHAGVKSQINAAA